MFLLLSNRGDERGSQGEINFVGQKKEESPGDGGGPQENGNEDGPEEKERGRLSIWLDETEKKSPRLFNLTTVVVMPLLLMILLAMLCGHGLATLESKNELDQLHDAMVEYLTIRGQIRILVDSIENMYEGCLDEYFTSNPEEMVNKTELKIYIDECRNEGIKVVDNEVHELDVEAENTLVGGMTLNWNKCFSVDENGEKTQLDTQVIAFKENWLADYDESYEKHIVNTNDDEAIEKAIEDARAGIDGICVVNSAGGAMFWFTIMTTIGYGNTAPKTIGGRAMVYSVGFFSILVFTALIGAAGYVFLTIADDFFESMNLHKLTKGGPAIAFWGCIMFLWLFVLSGMFGAFDKSKYGYVRHSLADRVWWSFISVTTVGFGDYYIPHDTFLFADVWYVPLIMLMGFVNMANFLLKVSELIMEFVASTGITDDESLHYLLQQTRKGVNILELNKNSSVPAEVPISSDHETSLSDNADFSDRPANENVVQDKIIFSSRYVRKNI